MQKLESVVILGASDKPDRYAFLAFEGLTNRGFRVLPVHPTLKEINGTPVFSSVKDIQEPVNTVTLYVGADKSSALAQDILNLKPKRIIFNPGAENKHLFLEAKKQGIEVMDACTLVMLSLNSF
jgi:predicted CoA-binding protein